MSGYGSSGVGTCDHTVDEDNSSMNNSSIGDKKINEGSSSNGYGSYVSNSSRNASVSSVGNQSEKRSYSYHKPNSKVDERILARTLGGQKERIYHKNSCGTDEYSTADSNSKRCTGRMKTYWKCTKIYWKRLVNELNITVEFRFVSHNTVFQYSSCDCM